MSSGLADYLAALKARDEREQAHAEYIRAYTKLADRTASLARGASAPPPEDPPPAPQSTKPGRPGTPRGKASSATQEVSSPSSLAQIRADLASTQKVRITLEAQLAAQTSDFEKIKTENAAQVKRIEFLERLKDQLERKLRDRQEELKGKGRLVEEVQDEMVALNLQLNIAEQNAETLKKENQELTRRWVEKMEREAEEMNTRSKW